MKEFITDLLQKTNQAKYNLMKQQVTLIYTTDFLSPTPETQNSKMIIETSTNPNNASFYSIDNTTNILHLNPGIYFFDVHPFFGGGIPKSFQLSLQAVDITEEEAYLGTLKDINTTLTISSSSGTSILSGDCSTILIIENWNSNICLKHTYHWSDSAQDTQYKAVINIIPLALSND